MDVQYGLENVYCMIRERQISNETLRKYQDELKKTTKEEGRFGVAGGKIAGNMKKTEKSVDNARFSMSRMIKTGLLMNIVMRAFSGVMSGIKAGFDNLAQYSNGTNSCLCRKIC